MQKKITNKVRGISRFALRIFLGCWAKEEFIFGERSKTIISELGAIRRLHHVSMACHRAAKASL